MVILLHVLFKGGGGLNANDDPAGRFLMCSSSMLVGTVQDLFRETSRRTDLEHVPRDRS